jgi:hypothetical protein
MDPQVKSFEGEENESCVSQTKRKYKIKTTKQQ